MGIHPMAKLRSKHFDEQANPGMPPQLTEHLCAYIRMLQQESPATFCRHFGHGFFFEATSLPLMSGSCPVHPSADSSSVRQFEQTSVY